MALMKQRRERDPRAAVLGGLLKDRRERAGLTRSELAHRLGISVETVSACEAGRPPRRSTLLRYLHRLPGLNAAELLGATPTDAPEASPSAWAAEMRAQGFFAESLEVGPEGVRVTGLRTTEADPESEPVRRALRRAACTAPGPVLRKVTSETERLEADGIEHEWMESVAGVEHRCRGDREGAFLLEIPVRRLVLLAGKEGPHVLRVINPVAGDEDLTEALYPGGRACDDGRLEITEPLPRLTYELVAAQGAVEVRQPEDFATALRQARARTGMSVRAVAAASGLGPASVSRTEHGCDPAWLALQGFLQAIPGLLPQDVLPGPAPREDWTRAQAAEYFAQVHGLHATSATKVVEFSLEGRTVSTIETKGLRPRQGSLRDAKVRFPVLRAAMQEAPHVLRQVLADDQGLSARVIRDDDDGQQSSVELRWPTNMKSGGLWVRRVVETASEIPMTPEAASEKFGGESPWRNGVSFSTPHPVDRLRLELILPHGFSPEDPRAGAWPGTMTPDMTREALSDAQRPRLMEVREEGGRVRLVLSATHPVFGLLYWIGLLLFSSDS
jgi:transcriptional regulator with XRE-family HTH domain